MPSEFPLISKSPTTSKGGTKIKAEGDFGHEPDLEIETAQMDDPDLVRFDKVRGRARKNFKSQMIHVATVKKCRVWSLNGKAFSWKDQTAYKPGYYQKVAECFQPYFDSLNIGGANATAHTDRPSTSVLFQSGDERSAHEQEIQRTIALEKWTGTMELLAGGQTKENIKKRGIIGEAITGTRSRTEFERLPLESILRCVKVLLKLEERLKTDSPTTDADLKACCEMAIEDVDHPGKNVTLLEAMLTKSVEKVNGKMGPQPAVKLMDREPEAMPF